jgi:hypothetical protein
MRVPVATTAALLGALACGGTDSSKDLLAAGNMGPGHDRDASIGVDARGTSDAESPGAGGQAASGAGGMDAAAAGGTPGIGDGGATGTGANPGNGGAGGTAHAGGTSGVGGASSGGEPSGGAANGGTNGSGGTCQVQSWCHDRDGDGHGDPMETQSACASPGDGWSATCDDCEDGNPLVHPGAECQPVGYSRTDGGTVSFDFDCDGQEDECGDFVKAAAECTIGGPLNCNGSGYLPNPDRTASSSQNPYCGSTAYRNCVSIGVPCVAQAVTKPAVVCH